MTSYDCKTSHPIISMTVYPELFMAGASIQNGGKHTTTSEQFQVFNISSTKETQ